MFLKINVFHLETSSNIHCRSRYSLFDRTNTVFIAIPCGDSILLFTSGTKEKIDCWKTTCHVKTTENSKLLSISNKMQIKICAAEKSFFPNNIPFFVYLAIPGNPYLEHGRLSYLLCNSLLNNMFFLFLLSEGQKIKSWLPDNFNQY